MSSAADDDSHSPPANVHIHRSTATSFNTRNDDETEEEYSDQKNENVREGSVRQNNSHALRNPATLPEIDILGLDDEAEEECGDQANENVREGSVRQDNSNALQNPATLPEIDILGLDDETEEESGDQDNENVRERQDFNNAQQNPVKLPEIDILGFGGVTDVTAEGKLKPDLLPISHDRIGIEEDEHEHEHEHEHEVIYNFPPGLSTLNVNGRPKFELVTVRENGRLQMFMLPNLSPQLVRSPGRNGRLKMWLLNDDQHAGEQALPPVRRSI